LLQGKIACLRGLRKWDEADATLQRALALHPAALGTLDERGWWYFDQKHYQEAVTAFDRVLKIQPDDGGALQGKISSLRLLRQFPQAHALIDLALQRHPRDIG